MKWIRRVLLVISVLLCGVISAALVGIHYFRSTPSWYHPRIFTAAELKDAANRADQKLADIVSWAASVQAQAVRQRLGTSTNESPIGPKTVTLNEDEANAFFDGSDLKKRLGRLIVDGRLILFDHQIILAGQSPQLGTIVSVQVAPSLDANGQLRLDLAGISAGMLPLPQSLVESRMAPMKQSLQEDLTMWQRSADIDKTSTANGTAIESAVAIMLFNSLNDRPSDPLAFVPFDVRDLRHALAVRMSAIDVADGSMTLTLQTLSPEDRTAMLERLKTAYQPAADAK